MKYAFNTFVFSGYPRWLPCYDRAYAIEVVAQAGYDGIEIGCTAPIAWPYYLDDAQIEATGQELRARGLAVSTLVPPPGGGPGLNPASPDPRERAATLDLFRRMVPLARSWGARQFIYVPGWIVGHTRQSVAWSHATELLATLAEELEPEGIGLAIEPTSANSNLVDTVDQAVLMAETVGRANVGVMFDTFHAIFRHESPADYVDRAQGRLVHVQLADVERRAPGPGPVDYHALLRRLRAVRYDGYLAMEIGLTDRSVSVEGIAREALAYMRRVEVESA